MYKLVIYCKSYINDIHRFKRLYDSVNTYNVDNIPFYVSVPSSDITNFRNIVDSNKCIVLSDEDIDVENSGWVGQQVVKSQFWKLGLCDNYLCVDSDCFFIREFRYSDFISSGNIPYTVCHEYKSFFEFMNKFPIGFDPYESFYNERKQIMELFGRTNGIIYDFGPGPTVWSCAVWKSLHDKYLDPNGLKFSDLIKQNPSEFTWYGEWLLYDNTIPLLPRGPIFKSYHYKHQYDIDKQIGTTIDMLKKQYFGIGIQSNWSSTGEF